MCMYHMVWNFNFYFMIHVLDVALLHPCLFLLTLEEQFMMLWLAEHLDNDEDLILDDANHEGGEVLKLLPYHLLEEKQNFGGEDYNIPT